MPETQEFRIHELEDKIKVINGDVDTIMRVQLPDMKMQIAVVNNTLKILGGLILTGISALIVLGLTG